MRRARRVEAGLTEEVEHGWGRAPGAVGVDEGGEVGSKIENGGGLGGSHRGGSGDFGIRCGWTESREDGGDGGVLELGREGVERQRGAGRRPALLNALGAAEGKKGGEGGGGRLSAAWGQEKSVEGGAGVWCHMSRHGTDVREQGRRRARATRGQRLTSRA
jgi:hypothetical protein